MKILKFICLLSFAALTVNAADDFILASKGESKVVIIPHGGVTNNGINLAARELADFLGKITGARFQITSKPINGYKNILVGTPYKGSKPEEISIKVKDPKNLEITGVNPRSVVYAAYDFLETLGCVFVAHDYDYVPQKAELSIPGDYAKVDAPFFWADRTVWSDIGYHDLIFNLKLRNHYYDGLPLKRGYPDLRRDFQPGVNEAIGGRFLPSKKFFETHPEWYALDRVKGTRIRLWVCVSNEEMYQEIFREIDEFMAKNPNTRELSIARGDTQAPCECDKCTELVRQYPDPDGCELYTIQDIIFSNRIGKHFAKKYPNLRFNMLPYGDRYSQNEKLRFEPNVGAASAELWRNHGLPADCNERSKYSLAQVCKLSQPGVHTYVWDYFANFRDFMIPFPNHRIFAQTARYYAKIGVRGVFCQHQFCTAGDMTEMKMWLFAKLLWNPYQDIDQLIDTYCNAAYGPSAKFVKEYIDIVEHARLRQRWTWFGCYVNDTSHYLNDEDCVRILKALNTAASTIKPSDPRKKLVHRARLPGLSMALLRYTDMIEPSKKLRFRLPPLEKIHTDWLVTINDSSLNFGNQMTSEAGSPYNSVNGLNKTILSAPIVASNFACTNSAVVNIPAPQLTGGKKMTRQKDKDGTEYCQLRIKPMGEPEKIWMNPSFSEIGHTFTEKDKGDWYVFATIRTGVTCDIDESSCYMGIYQKWYPNGVLIDRTMEVANQAVVGRKTDNGQWRTISLGKRRINNGTRVWIMNGVLHPIDYIDVKEIFLVDPRVIEAGVSGAK